MKRNRFPFWRTFLVLLSKDPVDMATVRGGRGREGGGGGVGNGKPAAG